MSEEYSRLIGNITIREIINSLKSGEKRLEEIVNDLNKISPTGVQPLVVELYLWLLSQRGYVTVKGSGSTAIYSLTEKWRSLKSGSP
ncbi:MAG: hypothetical protein QE164_00425 [Candidatus Nezhaarchaeota archaeon]|nr:hypothetical protein [Candidatus Nezhaarchaeota archaeon]